MNLLRTGLLILADMLPRLWLVGLVDDDVLRNTWDVISTSDALGRAAVNVPGCA